MRILSIAIILITFLQCSKQKTVTFDTRISQVFFGAPLDSNNKKIFDYYRASKHFSFEPPEDYAIYPPLSALDQSDTKTNTFRFKTHPHLFFKFKEGELIIENRKSHDQEVYSKPFIKFLFDHEKQCDAAYNILLDEFTILSTRKRIENTPSTKNAKFTDDNSIKMKKVTIWQGKGYSFPSPYAITFWLENDMDSKK